METKNYVIARDTDLPFAQAVEKVRGLLQEAGYGILSEIDVKARL
ncbi:MAG: ABC transporter ATP-binding protein, partial [Rubrobacter sp.]|nr:ABC transporter ATP-binding protein [Rubrobacter sp.]